VKEGERALYAMAVSVVILLLLLFTVIYSQEQVTVPPEEAEEEEGGIPPVPEEKEPPIPPGLTVISLEGTGEGFRERTLYYDWTVEKEMSPTAAILGGGESVEVTAWINVTQEVQGTSEASGVRGYLIVTNEGPNSTKGLSLMGEVSEWKFGGWFVIHQFTIPSGGELAPGEFRMIEYSVVLPLTGDQHTVFKAEAKALIANGKDQKASFEFQIPVDYDIVHGEDWQSTVTDQMSQQPGLFVTGDQNGPWHFYEDGGLSYVMTVTNVGAGPGQELPLINTATLVEYDSGDIRTDQSTIQIFTAAEPPPVPEVLVGIEPICPDGTPITEMMPGHPFFWNVTVINNGTVDLEGVWINDTRVGFSIQTALAAGETRQFDLPDVLEPPEEGVDIIGLTVCNLVEVEYLYNQTLYRVSAEACLQVSIPSIQIAKVALGPEGDPIDEVLIDHDFTWNITVANDGNVPLSEIWVNDTQLGLSEHLSLEVGQSTYFEIGDRVTDPPEDDQYLNTVTVEFFHWHSWLSEELTVSLFVAAPALEVEKMPVIDADQNWSDSQSGELPEIGLNHEMEWAIVVNNTGNVNLTGVWVNDTLLDYSERFDLAAGESIEIRLPYVTSEADMEDYVIWNMVDVSTRYSDLWLNESAQSGVFIAMPSLEVAKRAESEGQDEVMEALIGQSLVWNITVTNSGNVPLNGIWINDTLLEVTVQVDLEAGEIIWMEIPYTVHESDVVDDHVINVVEVECTYCHILLSDSDSYSIFIAMPDVSVSKQALCWNGEEYVPINEIGIGHEILYNITISNTGNVLLEAVTLIDPLLGLEETLVLAPGESAYFEVFYTVTGEGLNQLDQLVNTVWVSFSYLGEDFETSSVAEVFVAMPALSVEKVALALLDSEWIAVTEIGFDQEVVWRITVSNTGNVLLADIWVNDTYPDGGELSTMVSLVPGESLVFDHSFTTTRDVYTNGQVVCNTVLVDYHYCHAYFQVEDQWCLTIMEPCLRVEKTALAEVVGELVEVEECYLGQEIVWRIEIWNACSIELSDVWVNDSLLGYSQKHEILVGGKIQIDLAYIAQEGDMGLDFRIRNIVDVSTYYEGWYNTSVEASVLILIPCIDLEKSGPEEICWGSTIDWTIKVINCGTVDLTNVNMIDPMLEIDLIIPFLGVGEIFEATAQTYVPYGWCDSDWVENTAQAWVWVNDQNITAQDSHIVFVDKPLIYIEKTGPGSASPGETIEYLITVTNSGNVPLYDIVVTDPYLGLEWYLEELEVGASSSFWVEFTIPDPQECNYFTNWAFVEAHYEGWVTTDSDFHEVVILEPSEPMQAESFIGLDVSALSYHLSMLKSEELEIPA
jgi:uncharacterized repeat protein (TIGR01451 family)